MTVTHKNTLLTGCPVKRVHIIAAQPFYIASVFIFPIPIFRFYADYGGIKDRIFRFPIILRSFHHIAETYIKHRDIAIYDDDISQIGERPQVGQVIARNIAEYAKGGNKNAHPADKVDKRTGTGNTICRNFRKGNKSDHTGICK